MSDLKSRSCGLGLIHVRQKLDLENVSYYCTELNLTQLITKPTRTNLKDPEKNGLFWVSF
jgi:hypothetical protein